MDATTARKRSTARFKSVLVFRSLCPASSGPPCPIVSGQFTSTILSGLRALYALFLRHLRQFGHRFAVVPFTQTIDMTYLSHVYGSQTIFHFRHLFTV
jgi:hypothetical protein